MFRFENPNMFWLCLLIPVFILLFILKQYKRKQNINKLGDHATVNMLMPLYSYSRTIFRFILLIFALLFLIIALSRPQFGSKIEEVKREGVEIIIALDVSNSMNARDISPSRLERAKQAISKLVDKLKTDKIGLIVFAGEAYIQVPITTDYVSAKMFLNNINTGVIPVQGTAIGNAINLAINSFPSNSELRKAIIVITDGENHEDDAESAAASAAAKGITVYTLGMGLANGTPIPISADNENDFRKDDQGNVVITKLDEQGLQKIAAAGKGIYVRANNSQIGLNKLFENIDSLDKKEYDAITFTGYEEQYQIFLLMAVIFLLIYISLDDKKSKWFSNIKLFKN